MKFFAFQFFQKAANSWACDFISLPMLGTRWLIQCWLSRICPTPSEFASPLAHWSRDWLVDSVLSWFKPPTATENPLVTCLSQRVSLRIYIAYFSLCHSTCVGAYSEVFSHSVWVQDWCHSVWTFFPCLSASRVLFSTTFRGERRKFIDIFLVRIHRCVSDSLFYFLTFKCSPNNPWYLYPILFSSFSFIWWAVVQVKCLLSITVAYLFFTVLIRLMRIKFPWAPAYAQHSVLVLNLLF